MDSYGGQRFLVERLLNRRVQKKQPPSYLVRWRWYPPSADSREPLALLKIDENSLVEQYYKAHPVAGKTRQGTSAKRARKGVKKFATTFLISLEM